MAPSEMSGLQADEFDDLIEEMKAGAENTDCVVHGPTSKALIKLLRVAKITVEMDSKLDQLVSRIPPPATPPATAPEPASKFPLWAKIGALLGAALASAGAYFGGGGS